MMQLASVVAETFGSLGGNDRPLRDLLKPQAQKVPFALAAGALAALPGGCAGLEEQAALDAKTQLLGMSALDVQTCMGLPDQRLTVGRTTLLTYNAGSNRSWSISTGVTSLSMGGYCHATVRLDNDRVTRLEYSGDTDALLSRDASCAPIIKTCLLERYRQPSDSH